MNARAHRSPLVFRAVRGASWTIASLLALGCAAWAWVIGQFRDAGCNAR